VQLTVLGCTGSYPGPDGACSGYLVRAEGQTVLVDAGPGTVSALQHHVDLGQLTAVVLSHQHPDHWTDLGVLRTAWRWGLGQEGLPVFGTPQTRAIAEALTEGLAPTMHWTDIADGDEIDLGGLRMQCSITDHYVPTMALRFDDGRTSLAYSADTGPGWSFAAFGKRVRVALCEATLLAEQRLYAAVPVLHLTAAEAGRIAEEAGVQRLLLTHLPAGADGEEHRAEAAAHFGGPVEVVTQHATYDC
jgi:ribonuclease BN (tRNA processing enzyme)